VELDCGELLVGRLTIPASEICVETARLALVLFTFASMRLLGSRSHLARGVASVRALVIAALVRFACKRVTENNPGLIAAPEAPPLADAFHPCQFQSVVAAAERAVGRPPARL
jgi:hypothetical protein